MCTFERGFWKPPDFDFTKLDLTTKTFLLDTINAAYD